MWKIVRRNPRAFAYALLIHVAVIVLLIVGVDWRADKPAKPKVEVVQATLVDQAKLEEAARKQREAEEAARKKEQARLDEIKRKQAEEQRRQEEVKRKAAEQKKRKAEAKRQAELKKKKEAERKARIKREKAAAEKKRKAEAERKRKLAEKKRHEAEAKRKAAEAAKRKAAEEAKRKAEAERQAREDALRAQMEGERNQREIGRYVAVIRQQIERNWLRPQSSREGLKCTLQVRLIPSGDVIGVSVVKGSGDAAFDRSVENAVHKASPLPVPSEPALFEYFRELRLVFDPSA